jgi:hypothetical protein
VQHAVPFLVKRLFGWRSPAELLKPLLEPHPSMRLRIDTFPDREGYNMVEFIRIALQNLIRLGFANPPSPNGEGYNKVLRSIYEFCSSQVIRT